MKKKRELRDPNYTIVDFFFLFNTDTKILGTFSNYMPTATRHYRHAFAISFHSNAYLLTNTPIIE